MPYILPIRREFIDESAQKLVQMIYDRDDLVAGDLNYIFTLISHIYLIKNGKNYQNINNVIGALEGAKIELYRKVVANYEDIKESQNGPVSTL